MSGAGKGQRGLRRLVIALALSGCAIPGKALRSGIDFGEDGPRVWVAGPWEAIVPATDVDDVVDQLCPAVMALEHAREHDDGWEYCGLLYTGGGMTYASAPSPLSRDKPGPSGIKSCRIPAMVRDPQHDAQVLSDYHSHPWPDSPLSANDAALRSQRWSIRIQFDTRCHVYKLVPHVGEPVPGEVYERVGKTWRPTSIIRVEDKPAGLVQPPLSDGR